MRNNEGFSPLQGRYVQSGLKDFKDEEIVELMVSLVLAPQECKRWVKKYYKQIRSLREIFSATPQELQRLGLTPYCIFYLKFLQELPAEILRRKLIELPAFESFKEIFDYLYYSMRDLRAEVLKVIYLNPHNQIIDIADISKGRVDNIVINLRDVVENAVNSKASALLFAHNHPSGNPSPSKSDKQLTRDLVFSGSILQIKVVDHIIIGDDEYFSFADSGLTDEYKMDFLNLKMRGTSEAKRRIYQARSINPKSNLE